MVEPITIMITNVDAGFFYIWDILEVQKSASSVPLALGIDAGSYLTVPDWIMSFAPADESSDDGDDSIVAVVAPIPTHHANFTVFRDEPIRSADPVVVVDQVTVGARDEHSIIGADLLRRLREELSASRGARKVCKTVGELDARPRREAKVAGRKGENESVELVVKEAPKKGKKTKTTQVRKSARIAARSRRALSMMEN